MDWCETFLNAGVKPVDFHQTHSGKQILIALMLNARLGFQHPGEGVLRESAATRAVAVESGASKMGHHQHQVFFQYSNNSNGQNKG